MTFVPPTDAAPAFLLVQRLTESGGSLALAESCTGGMVAACITAVPGGSSVFWGGVVAYHNDVKQQLLGVPADVLRSVGAVSSETALAMARGVRVLLHTTLAAAVTGIAGPGGGSDVKPVGLVFVAVAGPTGERVERFQFSGDREAIRVQAADAVLRMLLASV